jgi:hypothetical protein
VTPIAIAVVALIGACTYTFIGAVLSQVLPLLGPGTAARHRRTCRVYKCVDCNDVLDSHLMGVFWPVVVVLWLPIVAGLWVGARLTRATKLKASTKAEVPQARVAKH